MKKKITFLFIVFTNIVFAQSGEVELKFNLPELLSETSGLEFFNNKFISHNDSGGQPVLYELDSVYGSIVRTVTILNAKNTDWEDIAQDEKHIFVADMGNNAGKRRDLKIYKISKNDYLNNSTVIAKTINFKYGDQKDFSSSSKNNFDAEALTSFKDSLLIFSKNRGDSKTKIYTLSKDGDSQIAKYKTTLDVDGLITGATYNASNDSVLLCGYVDTLSPFLIYIESFSTSKSFVRINLSQIIGVGSQVEGIAFDENGNYYFSREKFKKKIAGFSILTKPAIFSFELDKLIEPNLNNLISDYINGILESNIPIENVFQFEKIKISNELGETILKRKDSFNQVSMKNFKSGKYYAKIKLNDFTTITKEFIKN
ncbi:hypothetical protein [Urechidicola croceus]|uniref:Secretion system C-terminal sorting domain-containing protein n=1 Tax=Urechidicola croceus TaxID=1850246 RepID=A0A1D8P4S1_9FLAO|nr:hypothetical protein [Urechidicola croceus]AOW19565.1 hypothetical protein LPB138_02225 [Urechidicola croceus]